MEGDKAMRYVSTKIKGNRGVFWFQAFVFQIIIVVSLPCTANHWGAFFNICIFPTLALKTVKTAFNNKIFFDGEASIV
jgi:hypothetical protein